MSFSVVGGLSNALLQGRHYLMMNLGRKLKLFYMMCEWVGYQILLASHCILCYAMTNGGWQYITAFAAQTPLRE
jgi:hypothetical protein